MEKIAELLPRAPGSPATWHVESEQNIREVLTTPTPRASATKPLFTERQLGAYLKCPRKFFYEQRLYLSGRGEETAYLRFHACVYETLRWLAAERTAGRLTEDAADEFQARAQARLAQAWQEKGPAGHVYESFYREQAALMLERAVRHYARARGGFADDETEILCDFWEMMRTFRPCVDRIVGHNIYNFDLPFIYKRSAVRGVRPSIELNFARYRNQPIYDTMCEWEKWNLRHAISLDRLARVLGLESPKTDERDGSRIAELFVRGEQKTIRDYCLGDVITTRRIYRRMTFADSSPSKPTSSFEQPGGSCGATSPLSIR